MNKAITRGDADLRARLYGMVSAAALAALGLGVAPTTAVAQAASDTVGEVVVTAQFREQRLQQTPLSITAVDAKMIQDRGFSNIVDLAMAAPNLTIRPGVAAYGPSAQTQIRGVGQYDPSFALEPGVGMYVDDVYYASIFGSIFDLLDLERVEVLRGPQGTLTGKNSIGGAVKLYSKKPNGDAGAFVEATLGSVDRVDVRASFNLPLVTDKLFFRVSGVSRTRDGYITRYDFACARPGLVGPGFPSVPSGDGCKIGTLGGQSMQAVRASLRWVVNDAIEDTLTGDVTHDDSEAGAQTLLVADRNRPGLPALAPVVIGGVAYGSVFIPSDPYASYATFANPANPRGAYTAAAVGGVQAWGVSNTFDWRLSERLSLKYIAAYRAFDGAFSTDSDASPFGITTNYTTMRQHQTTHEVRLNGSVGERLDWTVGAYYFSARGETGGRKDLNTLPTTPSGLRLDFLDPDFAISRSKSVFAHGAWRLVEGLTLTTGVRYTDESKNYGYERRNVDGSTPQACTPLIPALCPINSTVATLSGLRARFTGARWDYRIGLDYRWTANFMTYAQWSTGFKGGGVNPRPFTAAQVRTFEPETMEAYEAGFKSDLFGRRMRFNASVFFNKYNDIQTTISAVAICNALLADTAQACAMPVNGGDADVKGAEVEIELRPVRGMIVDLAGSLLDFDYKRVAPGAGIAPGMITPLTPKRKASLGAQYEIPTAFGSLTPRVEVDYQSKVYSTAVNAALTQVDARTVANARLTWRAPDSLWQATLAVTNLFDKLYYVNKFDSYSLAGVVLGQPGRPREWSITVRRSF